MPCLIITGHPSAGKTTLAHKLKERALLHPSIDNVVIINEESACPDHTKNECYETAYAEKQTRGALKSSFDRAIKTDKTLIILDSSNYIKGFRYELHCISKAAGEKHGVLWVLNRLPVVEEWNNKTNRLQQQQQQQSCEKKKKGGYTPQLLKELIQRYEPPDERNRWDKPLYTIDVAPPIHNNDGGGAANKDSKTEALSQSVYNMHDLDNALGGTKPSDATTSTTSTSGEEAIVAKPKPKKSAFSRAKKAKPKTAAAAAAAPPQQQQQQQQPQEAAAPTESKTDEPATTTTNEKAPIENNDTSSSTNKKTTEELLDDILNSFLLNVQRLKAGASTQQHIATSANVLQELDATTQKLISAIANAQNYHTGGKLQVKYGSGESLLMDCKRPVALPELRRHRKLFMTWVATHPPKDSTEKGVAEWFLRYIEEQL